MDALDAYLEEASGLLDYKPKGMSIGPGSTGKEIAAYSFAATEVVWQALPSDIRGKMIGFLRSAGAEALASMGESMNMDWGKVTGAFDAVPSVIVKAIVLVVTNLVDISNELGRHGEKSSRAQARLYTIDRVFPDNLEKAPPYITKDDPDYKEISQDSYYWMGFCPVFMYANYRPRKGVKWSLEPCMNPLQGQMKAFSMPMFTPSGRWQENNGIPITCGSHGPDADMPFQKWFGSHPRGATQSIRNGLRKQAPKDCEAYISPLWYPFWNPAMPSRPMQVAMAFGSNTKVQRDPNALLMARQLRMLGTPKGNLGANGQAIRDMTYRLVNWIQSHEAFDLARLDSKGKRIGSFYGGKFDMNKDVNYSPTDNAALFFMRPDGAIEAYDHPSMPKMAEWGFSVSGAGRLMSLADVNAVVLGSLAFERARGVFLLDNVLCDALVKDGWHERLKNREPKLYAAIVASAKRKGKGYKVAHTQAFELKQAPKPKRAAAPRGHRISKVTELPRGFRVSSPSPEKGQSIGVGVAVGTMVSLGGALVAITSGK